MKATIVEKDDSMLMLRPENDPLRYAACHWLTNFSLRLAMLAEPKKPWFIMTAQEHSTVFDGKDTLFDFNFQAMGLPPQQCYVLAQGRWLKPVKRCSTFYAQHFSKE